MYSTPERMAAYQQAEQMAQQQQAQQQPQPRNPIGSGAMSGIEAAKASLEMNQREKARAHQKALSAFLTNIGQPQVGTGFAGALGAINQGFGPAQQAYQAEEQRIAELNHILMKQQQEQMRQQALAEDRQLQRQALEAYRAEQMQLQRDRLMEQQRYHDQMLETRARKQGASGSQEPIPSGDPYVDQLPELDKTTYRKMIMRKQDSGALLSKVNSIEKQIEAFEKETAGNVFDPTGVTSNIANPTKDFLGRITGSESLNRERTLRKTLNSSLRNFNTFAEQAAKGGAVSDSLVRLFENKQVMPTLDEPLADAKAKLAELKRHLAMENASALASTKYKRAIDPLDLERMADMKKEADAFEGEAQEALEASNQAEPEGEMVPGQGFTEAEYQQALKELGYAQ